MFPSSRSPAEMPTSQQIPSPTMVSRTSVKSPNLNPSNSTFSKTGTPVSLSAHDNVTEGCMAANNISNATVQGLSNTPGTMCMGSNMLLMQNSDSTIGSQGNLVSLSTSITGNNSASRLQHPPLALMSPQQSQPQNAGSLLNRNLMSINNSLSLNQGVNPNVTSAFLPTHQNISGHPSAIQDANSMQSIQSQPQIQVSNLPVSQTIQQQNVSGAVGITQPASAPPISAGDPSKRKMIQHQLLILIHASKCQKRENESNGNVTQCTIPYCQSMKNVINHMVTCGAGKACTVPRCSSSRQIISHWKNCIRLDCSVCMPLKRPSDKQQQTAANIQSNQPNQGLVAAEMKRAYGGLGLQFSDGNSSSNLQQGQAVGFSHVNEQAPQCSSQNFNHIQAQQTQGQLRPILQNNSLVSMANQSAQNFLLTDSNIQSEVKAGGNMPLNASSVLGSLPDNPAIVKDWHQTVTKDLRQHLVERIVYKIYPTTNLSTFQDARFLNLVTYARKVEGDMYCVAKSREEYYQLLAEKICKIQKELDEKDQQRKEIQQQQVQQVAPNLGSVIGSNSGEQSPKPPVSGAMSHLSSIPIPGNQQRMAPPNITVQTYTTATKNSELISSSGSQLSTSLNVSLSQSQFNQLQARGSPLQSIGLQQQRFNISDPDVAMANTSSDTSSVPITVGISVSQFSSSLQQSHPQMSDALKNRPEAV